MNEDNKTAEVKIEVKDGIPSKAAILGRQLCDNCYGEPTKCGYFEKAKFGEGMTKSGIKLPHCVIECDGYDSRTGVRCYACARCKKPLGGGSGLTSRTLKYGKQKIYVCQHCYAVIGQEIKAVRKSPVKDVDFAAGGVVKQREVVTSPIMPEKKEKPND